ncbi:hypothetical protein, partial [Neisseria sicca]|uniref:hypothetical protein n=1 Tax=Neisseria sicca TaxID=490 RepID=UPI0011BD1514
MKRVSVGESVLRDKGVRVGKGKGGKGVSVRKEGVEKGGKKIGKVGGGEDETEGVKVGEVKGGGGKARSKVERGKENMVVRREENG